MTWYLLRSEAAIRRLFVLLSKVFCSDQHYDEKGTLQQVFLDVCKMLLMLVVC